jgi:hypothetical protein
MTATFNPTLDGGDRSWTDAITNAVVLRGMDSTKYLHWSLQRDVRIDPIIPAFLHEFTHHWCFTSRVGASIALLRMRAGIRSVFKNSQDWEQKFCHDVVRYQTATLSMKPLTEGLALFAECDTRPGSSSISSQSLMALQMCFGFFLEGERGQEATMLALLQRSRFSTDFLDSRKARLYFRRFDCEDGYLPGYLAVKTMHSRLRFKVPQFEDPDLFLSYIRSYLYEDPILTIALLAPGRDEIRGAEAVANRIHSRLQRLLEEPGIDDCVSVFEKNISRNKPEVALAQGIDVSTEDVGRAQAMFDKACEELLTGVAGDDRMQKAVWAILTNLQSRLLMAVASSAVEIKRGTTGGLEGIAVGGETLAKLPQEVELSEGAKGEVMAVISSNARFVARVLKVDDKVRILSVFGKASKEDRDQLTKWVETRDFIQKIVGILEENLETELEESWAKVSLDHIITNTRRFAKDLYLSICTLNARDEDVPSTKQALLENGLAAFLDDDPDLARSLAAVGLMNSVSSKVETIIPMAAVMLSLDESALRSDIDKLLTNKKLPLIIRHKDAIFALV